MRLIRLWRCYGRENGRPSNPTTLFRWNCPPGCVGQVSPKLHVRDCCKIPGQARPKGSYQKDPAPSPSLGDGLPAPDPPGCSEPRDKFPLAAAVPHKRGSYPTAGVPRALIDQCNANAQQHL